MPDDIEDIVIRELKEYCYKYDVSLENIVDVISDLKVIPMIRGKAFEFTVANILEGLLSDEWVVEKFNINAQPGHHDSDVSVYKNGIDRKIDIECKLSKNNSFRIRQETGVFRVKCMRSRTFSDNEAAIRMANNYSISRDLLLMHADSYREQDFDFVITSLGNAFWETIDEKYTFNGTEEQYSYLKSIFPNKFSTFENFQKDTFKFILYAKSGDLIISERSGQCSRRKCIVNGTSINCGFIPNYPIVVINDVANDNSPWKYIDTIPEVFNTDLI